MIVRIPENTKKKIKFCQITIILQALEDMGNKRAKVAKYLGICPHTLRYWINHYPQFEKYRRYSEGYSQLGNSDWRKYDNSGKWKTKKV